MRPLVPLVLTALAAMTAAAHSDAQRQIGAPRVGESRDSFAIVRVIPDAVQGGETLSIRLSRQLFAGEHVEVTLVSPAGAGRSLLLRVVRTEGSEILAAVPAIRPIDSLATLVVATKLWTARLSGRPIRLQEGTGSIQFTPTQDTLRILSVSPRRAQRGDTVALQLSDSLLPDTPIRVSIGGLKSTIVFLGRTEVLVTVPADLPAVDTMPAIAITAGLRPVPLESRGLTVLPPPGDPWSVLKSAAIGVLVLLLVWQSGRAMITSFRSTRRQEKAEWTVAHERSAASLAPLEIPEGLVDALVRAEAMVYVGAGLGAQAGYPPWAPFVSSLLDWAIEKGHVPADVAPSYRASLQQGGSATVADALVSAVPGDALLEFLRSTFSASRRLPQSYASIRELGFVGALTTNFDNLLEGTFKTEAPVYTPGDSEQLRESLAKNRFFILKLYGDLDRPESVLISPAQFKDAVGQNRPFSSFMESLFLSRTMFFVGSSLDGIQAYLDGLGIRGELPNQNVNRGNSPPESAFPSQRPSNSPIQRTHYALVAVTDDAWRAQAATLRLRYNIEVLPFAPGKAYAPVGDFLARLSGTVAASRNVAQKAKRRDTPRAGNVLDSIYLENIGAFDALELSLDRSWNVLLGDNGVGKSTILKAIALGLSGKDGQRFAGRLVKVGKSYGKIVLTAGRNTYQSTIFQRDDEAEIATSGRAFEAEGWLTLGFSPIRTITWERPKGPSAEGKRRPASEDVLPLLRGEVDPRMNSIKQWFINQDYYLKDEASRGNRADSPAQLLDDFRTVMTTLLSGMRLDIRVKDARSGSVIAITDDGPVPIELVSQGTASLLGWIGVLLQRLYEVFGDEGAVRERHALVLVDEIDAHMHPAWQRRLVTRLKTLFPNVQFIASTHSPLIVGGMPTTQLFRFARVNGVVTRAALDEDSAMGRSDQVLRGQLFDLPVTFDPETEAMMAQYQVLLAKPNPTPPDDKRRVELERALAARMPAADSAPAERRALELVQSVIKQQLFPTPETSQLVLDVARKLLDATARSGPRA